MGLTARRKHGNTPTWVDSIRFASKREADRYQELKLLERIGGIKNLRLQVPFDLAPRVFLYGRWKPSLRYYADFVYEDARGPVVEDAKGFRDRVYLVKRHLMKSVHNIEIVES